MALCYYKGVRIKQRPGLLLRQQAENIYFERLFHHYMVQGS